MVKNANVALRTKTELLCLDEMNETRYSMVVFQLFLNLFHLAVHSYCIMQLLEYKYNECCGPLTLLQPLVTRFEEGTRMPGSPCEMP